MSVDKDALLAWGREYALCLRVIDEAYYDKFDPPPLPEGVPWKQYSTCYDAVRRSVLPSDSAIDRGLLVELFEAAWNVPSAASERAKCDAVRQGIEAFYRHRVDPDEAFRLQADFLKGAAARAAELGLDRLCLIELFSIGWRVPAESCVIDLFRIAWPATPHKHSAQTDLAKTAASSTDDRIKGLLRHEEVDDLLRRIYGLPEEYRAMLLRELQDHPDSTKAKRGDGPETRIRE